MTDALAVSRRIAPELVELRRRLHRIPELGLHLPDTQAAVLDALSGLDLEVRTGEALSSVVAVLRGRAPVEGERPVVLLRGDMDALPVTEEVDVDYVSERPGLMHACGHDLHMAGLVGAARILDELRDELVGDVVLMFQPAEEGPGGAAPMIGEGLLEAAGRRVDAAYAVHVYSADHPRGVWFGRPGTLMAAADEVLVTVRGVGGHGSAPERTKDPVPVACEIVLAFHTAVTRQFSVWDPVVLTVGKVAAGTKDNIIPDDAVVEATLRTFSKEHRAKAHEVVARVAQGIAQAHGMTAEVKIGNGYPVTVNDVGEFDVRARGRRRPVRRGPLGRHGQPRGRLGGHVLRPRRGARRLPQRQRVRPARPRGRRGQPLAAGGLRRLGRARRRGRPGRDGPAPHPPARRSLTPHSGSFSRLGSLLPTRAAAATRVRSTGTAAEHGPEAGPTLATASGGPGARPP